MNQKNGSMFEHIIYEFYIYLISYEYLFSTDVDIKNIAFECHIIHLRNLSYFFGINKKQKGWHVSKALQSTNSIPLVSGNMTREINKYASGTTGHLCDDRLAEDFKYEASRIYRKAFPIMKSAIRSFLTNAESQVRPELYLDWKDPIIQNQASRVSDQLASTDAVHMQTLGKTSMMSVPAISQMCHPAFAPIVSLGSLTSSFEQSPLPS